MHCSISPFPGWLYPDKDRPLLCERTVLFWAQAIDFHFEEDPDVEWFSGRISSFCLPEPLPVEAIQFRPTGEGRWGQTQAQRDLLGIAP